MQQFYIRKSHHAANRIIPVDSSRLISHICVSRTIFIFDLLHNAEFALAEKKLILIGTARSYLAVILPNMDPGTGGECG